MDTRIFNLIENEVRQIGVVLAFYVSELQKLGVPHEKMPLTLRLIEKFVL